MVDLRKLSRVREIYIYNVWGELAPRFRDFWIEVSYDAGSWMRLVAKEDGEVVGGLRGKRFEWRGEPVAARFVRVRLAGRGYLHLDQVEVFGD